MRKALLHYLQGVKARIPQLVWLLIAMLAILTLNNLVIRGLLSRSATYLSRENLPLLWDTLWMATLLYIIPTLIPHRITRRVVLIIELVLISAIHIMDLYLVSTYQMPYCDAIAIPIFATNPGEASGFFKSLRLEMPFMLIEGVKLLVAIFLPLGISWLISRTKRTKEQPTPWDKRIQRYSSTLLFIVVLVGAHILGINYLRQTRIATSAGVIQYNAHAPLARLYLSHRVLRHDAKRCALDYRPRQATPQEVTVDSLLPPHNVVLVVAENIYPHLMHCYNPIVNDNTPVIDSLLQMGSFIRLDSVYSASDNAALAAAWTFSLCPKDSPNSWDTYPSIYSIFRAAGYDTYWLDNTPRIARGLDVYPQLAADCDDHFFTNLRADDQDWTSRIPYDDAVLDQLKQLESQSRLTTIHLLGARSNIWWRIPEEFCKYNRLSANIDIDLSGDALDHLAQYYNVVYYQDDLLKQLIAHYQDTPTILIYCSPVGAYSEWHPYSGDQVAPETRGQVPMLLYLSPAMQRISPTLRDQLLQLNAERHNLSDLPQLLMRLSGIKVSLS
ncbi:sulfatase-like hydrolase/transferase [Porphyromonas asaccharolytica]|uniref:Sulfatase n=1 Tax=Porphyromonas asaccharolytica (strain ATCC 25260 / DSM 20707 / BCRC 10618 / CCUG 7834 / JCM 6326 / LMG 13178 / VPI 4198 / B440) TaxID=879243 RepID=F4KN86_PORAD|nr:sulfatase-like hydrolase/transferase [Porphyromonas asaccharolytica]AEE13397.1 sulfatase [Porphyromonas asaccharolytica DSM 20707]